MLKEWPLVAFTILGQAAVGVFLCFHAPFLVRGRAPSPGWFVTWLVVLALVVVLLGSAALISFFHLRHPLRARFVLTNLRSSWLSREILFELVFLGLVALSGWLAWLRAPSRGLHAGLLAAAGLAGALFLLSMAKLYMLPTLPHWSGVYTPLSFVLTSLVLGALATELVVRGVAGPGVFAMDLAVLGLAGGVSEIALAALAAGAGSLIILQVPLLGIFESVPLQVYLFALTLAALSLCLLVVGCGLYPGWLATRIRPARALQYE